MYMDFCFLKKYGYVNAGAPRGQRRMSVPPGIGVTASCELPNMGVWNQTWVLCKNSLHSFSPLGKKFKLVYY